eukprot:m.412922 g.412922  ORF g.412922 m.412922 type:complete len:729 (-) comp28986_c0_seq1:50-2236(-)
MMASTLTSVAVVLAMHCSVVTAAQANQAMDWRDVCNDPNLVITSSWAARPGPPGNAPVVSFDRGACTLTVQPCSLSSCQNTVPGVILEVQLSTPFTAVGGTFVEVGNSVIPGTTTASHADDACTTPATTWGQVVGGHNGISVFGTRSTVIYPGCAAGANFQTYSVSLNPPTSVESTTFLRFESHQSVQSEYVVFQLGGLQVGSVLPDPWVNICAGQIVGVTNTTVHSGPAGNVPRVVFDREACTVLVIPCSGNCATNVPTVLVEVQLAMPFTGVAGMFTEVGNSVLPGGTRSHADDCGSSVTQSPVSAWSTQTTVTHGGISVFGTNSTIIYPGCGGGANFQTYSVPIDPPRAVSTTSVLRFESHQSVGSEGALFQLGGISVKSTPLQTIDICSDPNVRITTDWAALPGPAGNAPRVIFNKASCTIFVQPCTVSASCANTVPRVSIYLQLSQPFIAVGGTFIEIGNSVMPAGSTTPGATAHADDTCATSYSSWNQRSSGHNGLSLFGTNSTVIYPGCIPGFNFKTFYYPINPLRVVPSTTTLRFESHQSVNTEGVVFKLGGLRVYKTSTILANEVIAQQSTLSTVSTLVTNVAASVATAAPILAAVSTSVAGHAPVQASLSTSMASATVTLAAVSTSVASNVPQLASVAAAMRTLGTTVATLRAAINAAVNAAPIAATASGVTATTPAIDVSSTTMSIKGEGRQMALETSCGTIDPCDVLRALNGLRTV